GARLRHRGDRAGHWARQVDDRRSLRRELRARAHARRSRQKRIAGAGRAHLQDGAAHQRAAEGAARARPRGAGGAPGDRRRAGGGAARRRSLRHRRARASRDRPARRRVRAPRRKSGDRADGGARRPGAPLRRGRRRGDGGRSVARAHHRHDREAAARHRAEPPGDRRPLRAARRDLADPGKNQTRQERRDPAHRRAQGARRKIGRVRPHRRRRAPRRWRQARLPRRVPVVRAQAKRARARPDRAHEAADRRASLTRECHVDGRMIARVAVLLPVAKPFDYTVPPALASGVAIGTRVWAPWGARSVEGVVVALDPPDAAERLKALHRAVDAPPLAAELVSLASWVADYYLAPPGEVMRLLLPAGGGASARRTAALTVEGARAAESLASALPPLALAELPASQRAILRLLADRGPLLDEKLDAEVPSCAAALRVLTERGLVAIDEAVRTRAARAHVILKPARAPADGELDRAPRRAEVFRRVAEAGALALDELTAADARASAHVRALVEAGLVVEERREIARDRFAAL